MNNTSRGRRAVLERLYRQLRQSLAQTGYISQGSVLQRSVATSGRSGFQWTRKVAQKTVTVALSREQSQARGKAVQTRRRPRKPPTKREPIPRKIILGPPRAPPRLNR